MNSKLRFFKGFLVLLFAALLVVHIVHNNINPQNLVFSRFYSNNWAGYIIAPYVYSQYNQVQGINGTFNVPKVLHSSSAPIEEVAVWIGIDGWNKNFSNTNLIQTGIFAKSNSTNTTYFAWYELLPDYAIKIPNMVIRPNDTIYAQIALINSSYGWNIQLKDLTTGQVFSKNVYYPTPMQTAEWIVEAPTQAFANNTRAVQTLAPFSPVSFTDAYLHVVGLTHDNITAIGQKYRPKQPVLINYTGVNQTYTTPITMDGLSFSVYYIGTPALTTTSSSTTTIQSTTAQSTGTTTQIKQATSIQNTSTIQASTTLSQSNNQNLLVIMLIVVAIIILYYALRRKQHKR